MWWLRWEKLPPVVLGPLMLLLGVYFLFDAQPFSWDQLKAAAIALVGICEFVSGVRKLMAEPNNPQAGSQSIYAKQASGNVADRPDYATYSEEQLRRVLRRIDRERFPDRVAEIEVRLAGVDVRP